MWVTQLKLYCHSGCPCSPRALYVVYVVDTRKGVNLRAYSFLNNCNYLNIFLIVCLCHSLYIVSANFSAPYFSRVATDKSSFIASLPLRTRIYSHGKSMNFLSSICIVVNPLRVSSLFSCVIVIEWFFMLNKILPLICN